MRRVQLLLPHRIDYMHRYLPLLPSCMVAICLSVCLSESVMRESFLHCAFCSVCICCFPLGLGWSTNRRGWLSISVWSCLVLLYFVGGSQFNGVWVIPTCFVCFGRIGSGFWLRLLGPGGIDRFAFLADPDDFTYIFTVTYLYYTILYYIILIILSGFCMRVEIVEVHLA